MALISVLPPSTKAPLVFESPFALLQDNWNDYSFQTRYLLYAKLDHSEPDLIGAVKILRLGQTKADGLLVESAFDQLPDTFVSIGESFDYYQRLNTLPPDLKKQLFGALLDVIAIPERQERFESEQGWNTSLFRGDSERGLPKEAQDAYIKDARAIYSGNFTDLPEEGSSFEFTPSEWQSSLNVEFSAPRIETKISLFLAKHPIVRASLPRRCLVLIGRNGSGKSTLLSKLARVAYASPTDRAMDDVKKIGSFDPPAIGFMKIITISYSAFDSFSLPSVYASDLQQIAKDIERGEGRFIYCGLRDVVAEVREDLETYINAESDLNRTRLPPRDKRDTISLKGIDQLADEFEKLYLKIRELERTPILAEALRPLLSDPSFSDLEEPNFALLLQDGPRKAFLTWSTGHKIALHSIASIVAHAVPQSIVLFDEPETHLHPPLTAALMHSVRIALEKTKAFAVIATHSPVVLQETLTRHVRIIERHGDTTTIQVPSGETFGENIGTLVYDTFGLTASSTDFHGVLDYLVASGNSLDEINEYFTGGMSSQALAYVMTRLAEKSEEEDLDA